MGEEAVPTNGDLVKRLRDRRKWSQEALAGEAKVSTHSIQQIERGKGAKKHIVEKVAIALGENYGDLLQIDPAAEAVTSAANAITELFNLTMTHIGDHNQATPAYVTRNLLAINAFIHEYLKHEPPPNGYQIKQNGDPHPANSFYIDYKVDKTALKALVDLFLQHKLQQLGIYELRVETHNNLFPMPQFDERDLASDKTVLTVDAYISTEHGAVKIMKIYSRGDDMFIPSSPSGQQMYRWFFDSSLSWEDIPRAESLFHQRISTHVVTPELLFTLLHREIFSREANLDYLHHELHRLLTSTSMKMLQNDKDALKIQNHDKHQQQP